MVARLDHITVVAPSLEAGAAYIEAALGVRPGAGRVHPGMATHNLLLALGSDVYLEVISADPGAAPVSRPRWFGLDQVLPGSAPRLAAWVASTDDIEEAAVAELGVVETMRREHHTWRMTVRADGSLPLDGAAPLLIQRSPGADPVAALPPGGLLLQRLRIRHPSPAQVVALFAKIGLAPTPLITVEWGNACTLVAEIQTPIGLRELGETSVRSIRPSIE
jgi:hypothetical protein